MNESDRSREALLALMDELFSEWSKFTEGPAITVRRRKGSVTYLQFGILWGLVANVYNTAQLVRAHYDSPNVSIMPLIRSVFEGAITSAWIVQVDDATAAFKGEHFRQEKNLRETLLDSKDSWWRGLGEKMGGLEAQDEEVSDSIQQAKYIKDRCLDFQTGNELYAVYRMMCSLSHATISVCDNYVPPIPGANDGVPPEKRVRILTDPVELRAADSWLFIATCSLIWSARALNYILPDNDYRNFRLS